MKTEQCDWEDSIDKTVTKEDRFDALIKSLQAEKAEFDRLDRENVIYDETVTDQEADDFLLKHCNASLEQIKAIIEEECNFNERPLCRLSPTITKERLMAALIRHCRYSKEQNDEWRKELGEDTNSEKK